MTKNQKIIATAVGAFALAVSANVVSSAIYTRQTISIDYKRAAVWSAIGISGTLILIKILDK